MKRKTLIRYLTARGCELLREGAKHTVFINRERGRSSTIPRHVEIDDKLARKICRDLNIQEIGKK